MPGYFYIDNISKQQRGPFSLADLQKQNIQPDTLVWKSGMDDWTAASFVEELAFIFNPNIPTPNSSNSALPLTGNNNQGGTFAQMSAGSYNPNNSQRHNSTINRGNSLNNIQPMPKNWLVESIIVTICCCLPFGIAGIIYATKVESLYHSGDYEGALQASKDAKKWTIIGFISTFAFLALYIIFIFSFGFFGALAGGDFF